MISRGDGSREAEIHAATFAAHCAGIKAHDAGAAYDVDECDHWRDGWIHAAELAQSRAALLRHRYLIRDALMDAYRLLRAVHLPARTAYPQRKAHDDALTKINHALAHLPADDERKR